MNRELYNKAEFYLYKKQKTNPAYLEKHRFSRYLGKVYKVKKPKKKNIEFYTLSKSFTSFKLETILIYSGFSLLSLLIGVIILSCIINTLPNHLSSSLSQLYTYLAVVLVIMLSISTPYYRYCRKYNLKYLKGYTSPSKTKAKYRDFRKAIDVMSNSFLELSDEDRKYLATQYPLLFNNCIKHTQNALFLDLDLITIHLEYYRKSAKKTNISSYFYNQWEHRYYYLVTKNFLFTDLKTTLNTLDKAKKEAKFKKENIFYYTDGLLSYHNDIDIVIQFCIKNEDMIFNNFNHQKLSILPDYDYFCKIFSLSFIKDFLIDTQDNLTLDGLTFNAYEISKLSAMSDHSNLYRLVDVCDYFPEAYPFKECGTILRKESKRMTTILDKIFSSLEPRNNLQEEIGKIKPLVDLLKIENDHHKG